jgi:hypothetical protein
MTVQLRRTLPDTSSLSLICIQQAHPACLLRIVGGRSGKRSKRCCLCAKMIWRYIIEQSSIVRYEWCEVRGPEQGDWLELRSLRSAYPYIFSNLQLDLLSGIVNAVAPNNLIVDLRFVSDLPLFSSPLKGSPAITYSGYCAAQWPRVRAIPLHWPSRWWWRWRPPRVCKRIKSGQQDARCGQTGFKPKASVAIVWKTEQHRYKSHGCYTRFLGRTRDLQMQETAGMDIRKSLVLQGEILDSQHCLCQNPIHEPVTNLSALLHPTFEAQERKTVRNSWLLYMVSSRCMSIQSTVGSLIWPSA